LPDSSERAGGGICTYMNRFFTGLQVALLALTLATGANAAVPPLLPAVATIHIKDFKYNPAALTVHAGGRVTFVNDDDEAHTVTATDKSFDSEGLDTAGSWQHVFTKPGTYHYFCELHPYMKATIVVLPAAAK
jgi:plastocyanin